MKINIFLVNENRYGKTNSRVDYMLLQTTLLYFFNLPSILKLYTTKEKYLAISVRINKDRLGFYLFYLFYLYLYCLFSIFRLKVRVRVMSHINISSHGHSHTIT